jgi:hypothetical protein
MFIGAARETLETAVTAIDGAQGGEKHLRCPAPVCRLQLTPPPVRQTVPRHWPAAQGRRRAEGSGSARAPSGAADRPDGGGRWKTGRAVGVGRVLAPSKISLRKCPLTSTRALGPRAPRITVEPAQGSRIVRGPRQRSRRATALRLEQGVVMSTVRMVPVRAAPRAHDRPEPPVTLAAGPPARARCPPEPPGEPLRPPTTEDDDAVFGFRASAHVAAFVRRVLYSAAGLRNVHERGRFEWSVPEAMRDFSVIAIIAAYNEADIIGQVVRHRRVSARAQAAASRVTR